MLALKHVECWEPSAGCLGTEGLLCLKQAAENHLSLWEGSSEMKWAAERRARTSPGMEVVLTVKIFVCFILFLEFLYHRHTCMFPLRKYKVKYHSLKFEILKHWFCCCLSVVILSTLQVSFSCACPHCSVAVYTVLLPSMCECSFA